MLFSLFIDSVFVLSTSSQWSSFMLSNFSIQFVIFYHLLSTLYFWTLVIAINIVSFLSFFFRKSVTMQPFWPGMYYLPASATRVMVSQVCSTTPSYNWYLKVNWLTTLILSITLILLWNNLCKINLSIDSKDWIWAL